MRQVPKYLLIGGGRLARHLKHYFSLLQIPFAHWQRPESIEELQKKLNFSTHVLILISDAAIEPFIETYIRDKIVIHCSGSLVTPLAFGVHPLFTFNESLYELNIYQTIPFVLDEDAPDFQDMFPLLPNPNIKLQKELKVRYHALCVMSANFSCMLWQKLFTSFEQDLKIPAQLAKPLLLQQMLNIYHAPHLALTGPLTRGDNQTIEKHLLALQDDPFQKVYQSFINCYAQMEKSA